MGMGYTNRERLFSPEGKRPTRKQLAAENKQIKADYRILNNMLTDLPKGGTREMLDHVLRSYFEMDPAVVEMMAKKKESDPATLDFWGPQLEKIADVDESLQAHGVTVDDIETLVKDKEVEADENMGRTYEDRKFDAAILLAEVLTPPYDEMRKLGYPPEVLRGVGTEPLAS